MKTEPADPKAHAQNADSQNADSQNADSQTADGRALSPAARRALSEAEQRRARQAAAEALRSANRPSEFGGQDGPDPVRYGDWEKGGIVSDF